MPALPAELDQTLRAARRTWLVTGAAGFIGSHLVESLLRLDQDVIGLDNFATGHQRNLAEITAAVTPEQAGRFRFVAGDIADLATCQEACAGTDFVLHQAALGSVPRSLADPLASHHANVTGTLNLLLAARDQRVQRFVYASSSAIYGDNPDDAKSEDRQGALLSPYAATKRMDELYGQVFTQAYGLPTIGLRYFNVFGPRQDPNGPYAAVIPAWLQALVRDQPAYVNGDGASSRDFCPVANVVQANLRAATTAGPAAFGRAYNIAVGVRTTLNELFATLRELLAETQPHLRQRQPVYRAALPGEIRHSLADIARAQADLGYVPTHSLEAGLRAALPWYLAHCP